MSDTTTTPTSIPNVEAMQEVIDTCCPNAGDHACKSCRAITRLLRTIPRDKSSAEYALWLMSQGYRVRKEDWCKRPTQFLHLVDQTITWFDGNPFNGNLRRGWAGDDPWLIYEEPPAVDDDEIRWKCVAFVQKLTESAEQVATNLNLSSAELARLKELQ